MYLFRHNMSPPLTLHEALNAYERGTSSISSPASKRVSYMTFSNYHRKNYSYLHTPDRKNFRTPPPSEHACERKFHRINSVLLKAHFASILSALFDFELIAGSTYERLVAAIDNPKWETHAMPLWARAYARFMRTDDLSHFVSVMNSPIE